MQKGGEEKDEVKTWEEQKEESEEQNRSEGNGRKVTIKGNEYKEKENKEGVKTTVETNGI